MKRVFGLVLALVLLVTLCACGNGGSDNENGGENPGGEEHTHAFGAWTTVTESTCAVAGSQQRACDCGETETQALALKTHTASDWIVDKPATSVQDGHQYQKCTVCGAILKEETISKDTVGSQGLEYAVNSDDKSCTITGMGICKDSEVVIPAVIDGYRVTSIGWNAFDGCSGLRSIQIPDSVIRIGAYAFRNCSSLRSIEIPDGVTSIDGWVFDCCRSLTSVQIPDSVTKIGYGAFNVCGSLESIQIPDSVTNIEGYVFHSCSKLKSIRFDGTKEGWETILKGDDWDSDTGNYTVYCTDGTIAKSSKLILFRHPRALPGGVVRSGWGLAERFWCVGEREGRPLPYDAVDRCATENGMGKPIPYKAGAALYSLPRQREPQDVPSQSAAPTALPKGEPRGGGGSVVQVVKIVPGQTDDHRT